jgi:hypothetical protein
MGLTFKQVPSSSLFPTAPTEHGFHTASYHIQQMNRDMEPNTGNCTDLEVEHKALFGGTNFMHIGRS